MRLKDKTAIITGAGGHLGRGTAVRMAKEGARIMVNDINLAAAEKTGQLIAGEGQSVLISGADVTRTDDVNKMVSEALGEWGQIDILVNNAGDIRDALLPNMSDDQWNFVIDLNLKGTFLCSRAVSPHMIERCYGKIVNLASMAYKGNVGQANYSAAKSGIVGLTRAVGLELARYGINVNCISPGMIDTPRTREALDEKTVERIVRKTPMRKMGEIIDIANAILFLVSDDSKFITRQVIHVAGGMEGL